MLCGEIMKTTLAQAIAGAGVVEKAAGGEGQRSGIVVSYDDTSLCHRKACRRPIHGNHGKSPSQRVQHLDG
jgi:hypothetical protein